MLARIPKIGLGFWGLSVQTVPTVQSLGLLLQEANNLGINLFDCSTRYSKGRLLAALLNASDVYPNVQLSLSFDWSGKFDINLLTGISELKNRLQRIRIIGVQPQDQTALLALSDTISQLSDLLPYTAFSISNLPPSLALLTADRLRSSFYGELFITLPCNKSTLPINDQFMPAFDMLQVKVLGYGALFGGRSLQINRGIYTYNKEPNETNQYINYEADYDIESQLSKLVEPVLRRSWLQTLFVGIRAQTQIKFWADWLAKINKSDYN